MTSLIGVMILVLIGILLTTLFAQTTVAIADPHNKDIVSLTPSLIRGFEENRAFPHGNLHAEPIYVEVHKDHVVLHPGRAVIHARELAQKDNRLFLEIDRVASEPMSSYFVLAVRVGGAQLARALREEIRSRGVDVGMDLFVTAQAMDRGRPVPSVRPGRAGGRALSAPPSSTDAP